MASDFGGRLLIQPERAAHVAVAGMPAEAALAGRLTDAAQRAQPYGHAGLSSKRLRQQSCLVEASPGEPPAMQRDRQADIRRGHQLASGARHQPGKARRSMSVIAVFECEDQVAGDAAIAHAGAGPVKRRSVYRTSTAKGAGSHVRLERQTAGITLRGPDKIDAAPTLSAQPAGRLDDGTARQTLRRQDCIERPSQALPDGRVHRPGHIPSLAGLIRVAIFRL